MSRDARLPGFYRKSVAARIEELKTRGFIDEADASLLASGRPLLPTSRADRMIENVIGSYGLPFAVSGNFLIDGCEYLLPLVVEEPSIVAGLSSAAKLIRRGGGFRTQSAESLLAGQVHLVDVPDPAAAGRVIDQARDELLAAVDRKLPRLLARGGGARDLDWRLLDTTPESPVLVVHVYLDTCDAMGANLVNSVCESLAPAFESLTGGRALLRILSNLADRSLVTAEAVVPLGALRSKGLSGDAVRDGIVAATRIAEVDPWRAATHNKGVMNGIDAVAIATGNDWRAIEAGAHAFAAAGGRYTSLTRWRVDDDGQLAGRIELPLKPGIVGGSLEANPGARLALAISGVRDAPELARLMASVGLAQNLAALRALVTDGIQHGHMRLHARSVVASAGVPETQSESVTAALVASGEITMTKAREIAEGALGEADGAADSSSRVGHGTAHGKVILIGEHAAVYDKHVLAVPLHDALDVDLAARDGGHRFRVSRHDGAETIAADSEIGLGLGAVVERIRGRLGVGDRAFDLRIESRVPPGMGLGASAAFAVATIRAMAAHYSMSIDEDDVNSLAFACETLTHGTPSGIDNTLATFGRPLLYRKSALPPAREIELAGPIPIVVACSDEFGSTAAQVSAVRDRRARFEAAYDRVFEQIDELAVAAADALSNRDFESLGAAMNLCHGLLNAIGVSTPALEAMVTTARQAGAMGAKLTGAGGGGSIVALCPDNGDAVTRALRDSGFSVLVTGDDTYTGWS